MPYFQHTSEFCYSKTALNNAIGAHVFSYESLGIQTVNNQEVEMTEITVIAALTNIELRCEDSHATMRLVKCRDNPSIGTWLVINNNTNGHYVV